MEYPNKVELLKAEDIVACYVNRYAERFYKFTVLGNKYSLPADQILRRLQGTRKLDEFICAPAQDITIDGIDFNYEPSFGVGVLCGVPWYLDFQSYTLKPFPEDIAKQVMSLFYGTTSFPDTINDSLQFKQTGLRDADGRFCQSIYRNNKHYSWGTITATNLNSDKFSIGATNRITTADGRVVDASTLYFNGRLIKYDITMIHRLAGGMLLKDVDDDITFVNYADVTANTVHGAGNAFYDNGFVYSIHDDVFVRMPVDKKVNFDTQSSGEFSVEGVPLHYEIQQGRGAVFLPLNSNSPISSMTTEKINFGQEPMVEPDPILTQAAKTSMQSLSHNESQTSQKSRVIDISKLEEVMYDASLIL